MTPVQFSVKAKLSFSASPGQQTWQQQQGGTTAGVEGCRVNGSASSRGPAGTAAAAAAAAALAAMAVAAAMGPRSSLASAGTQDSSAAAT